MAKVNANQLNKHSRLVMEKPLDIISALSPFTILHFSICFFEFLLWTALKMCTRIYIILAIIVVSCTATDGSPLGWGTWLGADWRQIK